ncbi:hypothetical protein EZV62_009485 [Acer yangbiense]|uniref:PGG domain-containing protein n=1 Tax=Acer yangbiense TaxID=1000413 RepID=A0A5C7HZD7_9ROSI|nr:hypothetical protein EZV62_009485 [Acer yangbiense]
MSTPKLSTGRSWFRYFQYEEGRDSPGDARNVILVVITLIAAVTFQAGVNPPGGVWQDDRDGHVAGRAIYASQQGAYYVFLISNTVALSTSILVIVSLTYRFPFHFELWIATGAMLITYGSAVFAVTPDESVRFRYILVAGAVPFVVRGLIQLYNKFINPKKHNYMNEIEN